LDFPDATDIAGFNNVSGMLVKSTWLNDEILTWWHLTFYSD
jgi:hypothetical protein